MNAKLFPFRHALTAAALAAMAPLGAAGAVLVIDDFATGGFSVSESYPTMRESGLSLPIGENVTRLASGRGYAYWHATSTPQNSGSMNYTLELRGDPPYGTNYLNIAYMRSGGFDLSGYDAFSIFISGLVGSGVIVVSDNNWSEAVPVPITGTGALVVPFSFMNNVAPINRLSSLDFRFIGLTEDFSVTVDQIAAVPEPSGASLVLLGGLMLLSRRRRAPAPTPRQA